MRNAARPARAVLLAAAMALAGGGARAAGEVKSGPRVGERPLPFTSNMVTGPNRGKQFCYICELKDEPAVLVFARRLDGATGQLLRGLRDNIRELRKERFFAWAVFLTTPETGAQTEQERQVYTIVREQGATELPVSVLGDPQGPPGYLVSPEAEVTFIAFRSGKVLYNRAFRSTEWNGRTAAGLLKEIPKVFGLKPAGKG